ncbi:MAG: helix-turn-helix transcriptional regulator [Lachnospiraceae bacterium]|nr:helix-turn-helix transcriptional regulator [Lachnospiraceae bacterium]
MVEVKMGKRLKSLRIQNGFSIKKLSLVFSEFNFPISIQTIYKWESDRMLPDIKSLGTLASIYNVGIESFFDGEGNIHSLNESELKLISYLHSYKAFKRILSLLAKLREEEI